MKASDFIYDNKKLSEFGFVICSFDGKGMETYDGIEITFNSVPTLNGTKSSLVSVVYEQNLEATIQICKNPCSGAALEIEPHEYRNLVKWLNRKGFYKLKFLDESNIDLYHEAAFTKIDKIEIDGKLYGLELTVQTNRPFSIKEPRIITINTSNIDEEMQETLCNNEVIYPKQDSDYPLGYYIEYADGIEIIDGKLSLINSEIISSPSAVIENTIKDKYIYSSYTMNYYKILSSTQIKQSFDDYNNVEQITILNAYKLDIVYKYSINDTSYEEGYIYPYTEVFIGDLTDIPEKERNLSIYNAIEDRNTYIANCTAGEVITMDYPIIQSSLSSHKIQNDFNWNFFRIANTYELSRNDLTISLPCTIKIKYSPIVKVGL